MFQRNLWLQPNVFGGTGALFVAIEVDDYGRLRHRVTFEVR